jgi:hypothetical protein
MKRIFACLAVALALAACESDPLALPTDERFVVQAYLFAGEPVTDVRITGTLPIGSPDTVAPPINDAEVTLIKDGARYSLALTPGDSGYYHYPGDDLVVAVGDVFGIEVSTNGIMATASTIVPPAPQSVSLSRTEVPADGFLAAEPVTVRWLNPSGDWYFVTHQNVEEDPEPIFTGGEIMIRPSLIVSEPTAADSLVIERWFMRHYGEYEVKVHRVNTEYERLYMSREQDTRDLNEPETNIENGLGIFTAFTRTKESFSLSRQ